MLLSESTKPSFLHVTLVAGEPAEMQLRMNGELEPELTARDVIEAVAIGKLQ